MREGHQRRATRAGRRDSPAAHWRPSPCRCRQVLVGLHEWPRDLSITTDKVHPVGSSWCHPRLVE